MVEVHGFCAERFAPIGEAEQWQVLIDVLALDDSGSS